MRIGSCRNLRGTRGGGTRWNQAEAVEAVQVRHQGQRPEGDRRPARRRRKATGDVRSNIDSAVSRLRDVSGEATKTAQDQALAGAARSRTRPRTCARSWRSWRCRRRTRCRRWTRSRRSWTTAARAWGRHERRRQERRRQEQRKGGGKKELALEPAVQGARRALARLVGLTRSRAPCAAGRASGRPAGCPPGGSRAGRRR